MGCFNTPQQRDKGTDLRVRGKRKHRLLGTQTSQTAGGVTRLGEGADVINIQLLSNIYCCPGNSAAAGTRLTVELGHTVQALLLGITNNGGHR